MTLAIMHYSSAIFAAIKDEVRIIIYEIVE